ncbi:MAG: type II secretion system protein GspM, partial [Acetobacteraceae bacterium]|nr:type II secretion system protein GspM [Acetobacteraceae bacterium]
WYDARAQRLTDRQALLLRMTRLAAELPALHRAVGAAGHDGPAPNALLAGDSDAIAGAALQGMVQDMASAAGATLASAETLPGQQQGAFRRIGLRVTLGADWPVLIAMLEAAEASQIRLLVDDLQLHATARGQAGPSAAAAPPIEASFVVFGFRPGREAPAQGSEAHTDQRVDQRVEVSAQAR